MTKAGTIELVFLHTLDSSQRTTMIITDVLYVPEITHRLALTDTLNDNGYSIMFSAEGPSIQIHAPTFDKPLLFPRHFVFKNDKYSWPSSCASLLHNKRYFPISP